MFKLVVPVFAGAGLAAIVVAAIQRTRRIGRRRSAEAAPADVPALHLVAIAAAVAAATEGRGRAVRVVHAPAHGLGLWTVASRAAELHRAVGRPRSTRS